MSAYTEGYHKTVLLVSENQGDSQHIERQFMDTGGLLCKLYRCTLVSAALEQLGNKKLSIDVIILDLRIPGAESPEALYRTLKKASGEIPIIVLTGDTAEECAIARPILEAGASGHIHRETIRSLISLIGSVLFPKTAE